MASAQNIFLFTMLQHAANNVKKCAVQSFSNTLLMLILDLYSWLDNSCLAQRKTLPCLKKHSPCHWHISKFAVLYLVDALPRQANFWVIRIPLAFLSERTPRNILKNRQWMLSSICNLSVTLSALNKHLSEPATKTRWINFHSLLMLQHRCFLHRCTTLKIMTV